VGTGLAHRLIGVRSGENARLARDPGAREPARVAGPVQALADVDEQGGVVNDRALLFVEPDSLGQPQRDQALPQDVLHRLPETEVYAERERGHQLRQPNLRVMISLARPDLM
jgi:hypothetical protein